MAKPSLPQGTRDFNATILRKRDYIFNVIKNTFELHGFEPLQTPALENLETLMGKYGDEGDKLIFKVLNNGLDNKEKLPKTQEGFEKIMSGKSSTAITERALKYDLTIPFARYVAMNFGQLTMPFKRYQMQPVWRADKPQKGRYREFYQCDADVVGSKSLWNEVDLVNIYNTVFTKLGIEVAIKVNSRKILAALAEACGGLEFMTIITTAIDKLDKIGIDKVKEELVKNNIEEQAIAIIEKYLQINGTNEEKIIAIKSLLQGALAEEGLQEIDFLLKQNLPIVVDFTLARGLNYYTGLIFEIKALKASIGSIGGGGRYDDLTGLFGVPNVPGVGISFGVDRIYDVMEELNLFPENINASTKVLCFNLGFDEAAKATEVMQILRNQNISCDLYHEVAKFDKQFKYADKKGIPFALIIGASELQNNECVIKNLATGNQQKLAIHEVANYFSNT
ncbi:MAG: histidine--tRNA ligase [Chitinophagaceae bacterium]